MRKPVQWLHSEIDEWVKDGVIAADQAEAIRARYPVPESETLRGRIIFSSIGAVIFGLGVILLFAYNWEKMHKFVKLAVIFSGLFAAHGTGLWFSRSESRFKAAGEGLHVLGTMMFGAGIWLVAQIYHIDEHYPNALLIWGIGALLMGWAIPSIPQAVIACILLMLWTAFEAVEFRIPNHVAPLVIMGAVIPLAWIRKSRVLTAAAIAGLLLALSFNAGNLNEELMLYVLFFAFCSLIAVSLIVQHTKGFPQSARVVSFFGYMGYLTILYIQSFKGSGRRFAFDTVAEILYVILSAMIAFGLWLIALHPIDSLKAHLDSKRIGPGHLGVPLALIVFVLQAGQLTGLSGWVSAGVFNLLFLFHSIQLIREGCQRVNIQRTAAGCVMFSLLAAARYVDLFNSLILRAVVFFIVGGAVFAAGNFYSKAKKQQRSIL